MKNPEADEASGFLFWSEEMEDSFLLEANLFEEFRAKLNELDQEVLPRGLGRTKNMIEIYAFVRLFRFFDLIHDLIPVKVFKRESPDFSIINNWMSIGLECVEAVYKNEAKRADIINKYEYEGMFWSRPHHVDEPVKSKNEIIKDLEDNYPGPGWYGDSVEESWADGMHHFILKKINVFKKDKFSKMDENWLLIYDNLSAPALNYEKGLRKLNQKLMQINHCGVFDRIFIVNDRCGFDVGRNKSTGDSLVS